MFKMRTIVPVSIVIAGMVLMSAGPAPATAQAGRQIPVNLSACQGSLNATQLQLENLCAKVTEAATGKPATGVPVVFSSDSGQYLGAAYTDQYGIAKTRAPVNMPIGAIQEIGGGYDAQSLGTSRYAPAAGHGAITIGTDSAS